MVSDAEDRFYGNEVRIVWKFNSNLNRMESISIPTRTSITIFGLYDNAKDVDISRATLLNSSYEIRVHYQVIHRVPKHDMYALGKTV